jgi:hypothetical protein
VENYVTEEMRGPRVTKGFETEHGYIVWFYVSKLLYEYGNIYINEQVWQWKIYRIAWLL